MGKFLILSFFFFISTSSLTLAAEMNSTLQVTNLPLPQTGQVDEHLPRLSPIRFLSDHPLYFLITWKENAQRFLKANAAQKAHFDTILAGKRIKETYLLVKKGNFKTALKTTKKYGKQMERLEKELAAAQKQGADVVVTLDLLADDLFRHQDLMAQIVSTVPNEHKTSLLQELNWANEKLIAVAKLLEKGRPDQVQRILSRYQQKT